MSSGEPQAEVGIIGGSGVYALDELTDVRRVRISTPFGDPSDEIVLGVLSGTRVAFVPRHGEGHRIPPSRIPARANIHALKSLGVRQILGVSAVGSLREDLVPGHLVVPDQIIDRTREARGGTFFDQDVVVHVPFGDPYCERLRLQVAKAAVRATETAVHDSATYLCMEGPQFSTRAESEMYRAWGCDIIGMTAIPEAKLAREAELCYAGLCMVTDYDCWREGHEDVTAQTVVEVMRRNSVAAKRTLAALLEEGVADIECGCHSVLASSINTSLEGLSPAAEERFALLLGKYLR
ncbi:S-methyl-5'-thioadenosine phosphorylase [Nocardia terpenica]|uniref:S-methyl-5'-thioadenosine phosphorylase n=1 Tax=Nocardia terpenica TaxID=455432 RepID=UPI001894AC72|nr:S-methyl-5'-thioadenosine phosphorylase [Nocardia terpenica]MBF6063309.1 S-methyl-5'-thioadenosine phosphorylase [Nocardia terpenica]MBF6105865.1 S-methyl-5'-thioadenosine phosphorylase [Nocardia terpenica]MBF6113551.1 S-methyl-5'-thioadenosine phosphorylase [Nocardia terpenica]MBF6119606.1 S-methyl-5'-thioadenosine phosphorylase [Nocardia terpenica]MBF6152017.1 S-methyl-5'-thioadenosine phosphorylase [Nocardia terpenica]